MSSSPSTTPSSSASSPPPSSSSSSSSLSVDVLYGVQLWPCVYQESPCFVLLQSLSGYYHQRAHSELVQQQDGTSTKCLSSQPVTRYEEYMEALQKKGLEILTLFSIQTDVTLPERQKNAVATNKTETTSWAQKSLITFSQFLKEKHKYDTLFKGDHEKTQSASSSLTNNAADIFILSIIYIKNYSVEEQLEREEILHTEQVDIEHHQHDQPLFSLGTTIGDFCQLLTQDTHLLAALHRGLIYHTSSSSTTHHVLDVTVMSQSSIWQMLQFWNALGLVEESQLSILQASLISLYQ